MNFDESLSIEIFSEEVTDSGRHSENSLVRGRLFKFLVSPVVKIQGEQRQLTRRSSTRLSSRVSSATIGPAPA